MAKNLAVNTYRWELFLPLKRELQTANATARQCFHVTSPGLQLNVNHEKPTAAKTTELRIQRLYRDLARAKREALVDINSLLKRLKIV